MLDDNEFFREVTLRICGNLALERALHETLLYVRDHIPIDEMFMEYFDPGLGAARTIARADCSGGVRLDVVMPLTERSKVDQAFVETAALGRAIVLNHPEENWIATELLRFHNIDELACSVLTMQLVGEDAMFGGLVGIANRRDAFTEEHARAMSLLAEPFRVAMVNALQYREVVRLKGLLEDDNAYLQRELRRIAGDEIVGADFGLRGVMRAVRQVAPTDSPVLLTGETGVGKDVIANAIHLSSPRQEGPFIAFNCGAIPEGLIDSELFGHEKGAFTGALARKRGRFERAHHGTILLDEIGEMPLDAQVRLLRVIQNREVERVGGTDPISLDIRIIAATNQDLRQMVAEGRFRQDLWYRLNVFPIEVPPLRERRGDIPALVQHFLESKAGELKTGRVPTLADGAIDVLMAYDWPGNVRELANVVERAMILHSGEPLRFDELAGGGSTAPTPAAPGDDDGGLDLDAAMRRHIERVLRLADGKIHGPGGAAEKLGINPNTLRYRMTKLGIPFRRKAGDSGAE